jgi:hypothetical protein
MAPTQPNKGSNTALLHVSPDNGATWEPWDGQISASLSGADGAIEDGVTPAIRATVKDYANSKPVAVITVDTNGDPTGGSAVSIADGSDAALGATADAKVTGDTAGTVSAKLRGLSYLLALVVDTVSGWVKVRVADALPAGTNNIGDVDVVSSALPTGAATAANQATVIGHLDGVEGLLTTIDADTGGIATSAASIDGKLPALSGGAVPVTGPLTDAQLRAAAVPVSGTFWQATQPVSGTVTAANAAGDVAHDAADSGNPVKVGGKAVSSEPAPVAAGDRANFLTDLVGKLITLPYANPENFINGATAAMTGTTSTSLIAAPGAGLRNYITQLTVSNSHATVGTDIELQDGNGGTTFYVIPAAAVYGGAALTFPTPLKQPTANTALYVKNSVTGASTRVSASGYKGA